MPNLVTLDVSNSIVPLSKRLSVTEDKIFCFSCDFISSKFELPPCSSSLDFSSCASSKGLKRMSIEVSPVSSWSDGHSSFCSELCCSIARFFVVCSFFYLYSICLKDSLNTFNFLDKYQLNMKNYLTFYSKKNNLVYSTS